MFLAGASGVIGRRLIPLLVGAGHTVGGMTRTPGNAPVIAELGAEPVVCDVYDRDALIAAITAFAPDLILNELTDLPDDLESLAEARPRNARIRVEGAENLAAAAHAAGEVRIVAQSIAWEAPPGPTRDSVAELERVVLESGGVVLRYGQFYGPGTYYPAEPPEGPRVHIDTATKRTVAALDAATGIHVIID